MTTDFMHCKGDGCQLKELCLRHYAHMYTEGKKHWMAYYFEPSKVGNDCEAFVNKNNRYER